MDVVRKCYKLQRYGEFSVLLSKAETNRKSAHIWRIRDRKTRRLVWSVLFRLRVNSNIYAEMIVKMRKLWFSFWW